jgi:hypothetical protein
LEGRAIGERKARVKAICVNGPLKGRLYDMGPSPSSFSTIDPATAVTGEWSSDAIYYRPQKFGFTSGGYTVLLWVAYTGPEPEATDLADILLSAVAKEALIMEARQ